MYVLYLVQVLCLIWDLNLYKCEVLRFTLGPSFLLFFSFKTYTYDAENHADGTSQTHFKTKSTTAHLTQYNLKLLIFSTITSENCESFNTRLQHKIQDTIHDYNTHNYNTRYNETIQVYQLNQHFRGSY
jgi:hypothetical protein